jgi:predicted metal-dependent phosphoesterase TrpH
LLDGAVKNEIDGVVLTEHGRFWPEDELFELRDSYPELTIFNGAELDVGSLHHVLLYLPEPRPQREIPRKPDHFVEAVRGWGGSAVAAHPYRFFDRYDDRNDGLRLNGVEFASGNMHSEKKVERARRLADRWDAVSMASSDAHARDPIGRFLTELDDEPEEEAELIAALREGQAEPKIAPRSPTTKSREVFPGP